MLSGEAKMEINFVVEGSPVVWGVGEREQRWRTQVSNIARQALKEKYVVVTQIVTTLFRKIQE